MGSAIVEEAVRRGLAVTCVTRTGTPPGHILSQAWSANVDWLPGDALRPETYRDAMGTADAVVTSVGVLPLPSLTHEEVVRGNGDTNVVPARTAKELGVDRLVVVGASIPPFVPGVAFGVPGLFEAGYAKGKKMALDFARDEFVGSEKKRGAVVLQPESVSGRATPTDARASVIAMSPVSRVLRAVPVNAVAELAPPPVGTSRAAVAAATGEKVREGLRIIDNLRLLGVRRVTGGERAPCVRQKSSNETSKLECRGARVRAMHRRAISRAKGYAPLPSSATAIYA